MKKLVIRRGKVVGKRISLTFDDGPDDNFTVQILDILKISNVKVTFFISGDKIENNIPLIKRMLEEGHEIGNHAYSHRTLCFLSGKKFREQVEKIDELLAKNDLPITRYFRPPFGRFNPLHLNILRKMGKQMILWDNGPKDFKCKSSREIQEKILRKLKSGSIIVLHDGNGNRKLTIEALPGLIEEIRSKGYIFNKISDLLV